MITVKVIKNPDGTQTVDFNVPDEVLPTYTPELIGMEYYYEALPARLIYQVGLTAEAEQRVLALQDTGGELTFYTNKWQDQNNAAFSSMIPAKANPFYNGTEPGEGYHEHQDPKTDNTTGTAALAVDCHMERDDEFDNETRIYHYLGNNGKLVFSAEVVDIPVQKKWEGVVADIMNPVTFELYRVTEGISEDGTTAINGTFVAQKTLSINTQWQELFSAAVPQDENTYYVIVEPYVTGYQAFYDGTLVTFTLGNTPVTGVKVDLTQLETKPVTVTNIPTMELPETGGSGTAMYTLGGCFLIVAAGIALMYIQSGKGRKGAKAHS